MALENVIITLVFLSFFAIYFFICWRAYERGKSKTGNARKFVMWYSMANMVFAVFLFIIHLVFFVLNSVLE